MDPQRCLEILAQAQVEHARLHAAGENCGDNCKFCVPVLRGVTPFREYCGDVSLDDEEGSDDDDGVAGKKAAGAAVRPQGFAPAPRVASSGGEAEREREVPSDPASAAAAAVASAVAETSGAARTTLGSCADQAGGQAVEGSGQLIDLSTGANETVENKMTGPALLEMFPELGPSFGGAQAIVRKVGETAAPASGERAQPADLALAVVKLHEARVAVHRAYDGAFMHLLKGQGGGPKAVARTYPYIVSCATARFQTLSEAARAVATALEEAAAGNADVKEAAELVRKIQQLEQARLSIVAMHHIEQSQLVTARGGDRDNCARLRQQLLSAAEELEETVSELRYCAAELREEE